MLLLMTLSEAHKQLATNMRDLRLQRGLTQADLAQRAGVALPTLRRFEQRAVISLESFLKLQMVLGRLDDILKATEVKHIEFSSIDDVLKADKKPQRKRGWRS